MATVSANNSDPVPGNNTANESTTVIGEADLTLTKICPATAIAGGPISYTLIVTNSGPSDAQTVDITDTLPGGVIPTGATVFNIPTLAAGASTTVVVNATVDASTTGVITNQADVITATTDTNLTDNSDSCVTVMAIWIFSLPMRIIKPTESMQTMV